MEYAGFVGPSNELRSRKADAERTINWYLETTAPGVTPAKARLAPTPGLQPWVVLDTGPIRGLFYQDGRAFAVTGQGLYELAANQTASFSVSLPAGTDPAIFASNGTIGNQLFFTVGGQGYIFNLTTNAVTTNPAGLLTPTGNGATFIDGYFLSLLRNTRTFQFSALADGTSWPGLNVDQVSQASDNIQAIIAVHRELWILGSKVTTVWTDVGQGNTVFAPIPGVNIQQGCGAAYSPVVLDNTLFWLGGNELGNRVVYRANGYTPQRISTHAVEYALDSYQRVDDAIGWAYQLEGHSFYVLFFPSGESAEPPWTHWVYDVATGTWYQWALWDPTGLIWEPHLGRCHMFAWGKHLVGDRLSGAIYELSLNFFTDGQVS